MMQKSQVISVISLVEKEDDHIAQNEDGRPEIAGKGWDARFNYAVVKVDDEDDLPGR
jgi:hypothetical protein